MCDVDVCTYLGSVGLLGEEDDVVGGWAGVV